MNASLRALIGIVLAVMGASLGSEAHADYDAAGDLSATADPNGVWSYGWTATLGSALNLDAIKASTSGLDLWEGTASDVNGTLTPFAIHNGTAGLITSGTVKYAAGQLGVQPGPQDQYGVIRFTAPGAGTFSRRRSPAWISPGRRPRTCMCSWTGRRSSTEP